MKWPNKLPVALAICLGAFLSACAAMPPPTGGKLDPDRLIDGEYQGRARVRTVMVDLKVRVDEHRVVDIEIVKHVNMMGKDAELYVPNDIIRLQSTKVDAVSGATWSSRAIMNATQNALEKALR